MQSPHKRYGQAQNEEVRDRVKHANGDELCVEINATVLDAGNPIRADRHTLKHDHKGTRDGIAQYKSCDGPEDDLELLTRENAVVEEEDGEFDGDHRRVIELFYGDLGFCE